MALLAALSLKGTDPNGVHDLGDGPHFEGWYYRITQPDSENSWVPIAAYWMDKDKQGHAFVELIHSPSGQTFKEVFTDVDIERIQDTAGTFELQLGELWLSADQSRVQSRRLNITGSSPITVEGCARAAPDDARNRWTMGWATEAPFIPLKWHVHHLKAFAQGTIKRTTQSGSLMIIRYTRKRIGAAFPTRWIWFQTNDFGATRCSRWRRRSGSASELSQRLHGGPSMEG